MGVSRSASFVIMFIMKKYRVPFEDVLEFVRDRRNVVDPNEGFVRQLVEFEKTGMTFKSGAKAEPIGIVKSENI